MKFIVATILVILGPPLANAQGFGFLDIPASNSWTKVQNGEVTQWSIVPENNRLTRIDLVSYVKEDGSRTTYYLIRSACSNGKVSKYVVKYGNRVGLGEDCEGNASQSTSTIIEMTPRLPQEALSLTEH